MKSTALAEKTASTRATEMIFPKETRLYSDEYSYQFLSNTNKFFISIMKVGFIGKMFMGLFEKMAQGVYGGIISRTRYMDDVLEAAIEGGFDAVVNLGGGYDTKCLRFDMGSINYYHVDQPLVVDQYRKLMSRLDSGIPKSVHFVPIDFNTQDLEEELKKAGFDRPNC